MIACPRCQRQNPADAAFCQECGSRLETPCPECGATNQLGAKFCKKCGQRLVQTGSTAQPPGTRLGDPKSYTPKHLAEWTRWSVVYELDRLRVHFRTETHAAVRRVDLAAFDLACPEPARMLDVDAKLEGDVTGGFAAYATPANLDLLRRSYRKTPFLAQVPEARIEANARHPDRAPCTLPGPAPR